MRLELFFGKEMFVDTNIFVYALARRHRHNRECNDLLVQINHGDIAGFTSSTVISETKVAYNALDDVFNT